MLNKIFIFTVIILFIETTLIFSQNIKSVKIKEKKFTGWIFYQEVDFPIPIPDLNSRFTPAKYEIIEAEKIIRNYISNENKILINQGHGFPIIHKKLYKYKRQYFGYINREGEKVIWVNCIYGKKYRNVIDKELIFVLDGGSYFWQIKVNLSKKKLFDLIINSNS